MNKIIIVILIMFSGIAPAVFAQDWSSWKNIYGIVWRDNLYGGTTTATANLEKRIRYIKQMGYDGISFGAGDSVSIIQNYSNKNNLRFYLVDPHLHGGHYTGNTPTSSSVKTNWSYTQAEKDWYNLNMVWKSNDAFPNNFATGYFHGTSTDFSVEWDFQQQRVIDLLVEKIVEVATSLEDKSKNFTFGGCIYDVARLAGDFNYWNGSANVQVNLSYWTGVESGLIHGTITHEYSTYSDGRAAFFKKLNSRLKEEFGTATVKWIIQPSYIYYNTPGFRDEWVWTAEQRSDYAELQPDLYLVENQALSSFLTESNIFDSIIPITKDMVGSAHAAKSEEDVNRSLAGNIGINGAWYHWAPRFGGSVSMPDFQSITEVWPRLKLIRCITNWDNLAQMGTPTRSAGNEYGTMSYRCEYSDGYPRSIINNRIMYSYPYWDINKIYVAVGTTTGTITINSATRGLIRAKYVNEYFEPIATSSALADIELSGDTISWKSTASIESGTWTGYVLEIGTKGVSVCTY